MVVGTEWVRVHRQFDLVGTEWVRVHRQFDLVGTEWVRVHRQFDLCDGWGSVGQSIPTVSPVWWLGQSGSEFTDSLT